RCVSTTGVRESAAGSREAQTSAAADAANSRRLTVLMVWSSWWVRPVHCAAPADALEAPAANRHTGRGRRFRSGGDTMSFTTRAAAGLAVVFVLAFAPHAAPAPAPRPYQPRPARYSETRQ